MWRSSNSELRTCMSDKTRHMKINRLQQFLMQCIISSFSPFENVPLNNHSVVRYKHEDSAKIIANLLTRIVNSSPQQGKCRFLGNLH
jgi:hypothetical protein